VVVVVVAVLRIVFNIKNRLRNELKRYVKQAINREDLEAVDVRQVLCLYHVMREKSLYVFRSFWYHTICRGCFLRVDA